MGFSVSSYQPQQTALASMRMMMSAFSVQMEAKKFKADEGRRDRLERQNTIMFELHKKAAKTKNVTDLTMAKSAALQFARSAAGGIIDTLQNGLGSSWNMDDATALEQAYFLDVDKMGKQGILSAPEMKILKNDGAAALGKSLLRIENYKKVEAQNPHMIKALIETQGVTRDQIAGMGVKAMQKQYKNVMVSMSSRKEKYQADYASAKASYNQLIEDTKGGGGDTDEMALAKIQLTNYSKIMSEARGIVNDLSIKMDDFNGNAEYKYDKQQFDDKQTQAALSDRRAFNSNLMSEEELMQNKKDRTVSALMFDNAVEVEKGNISPERGLALDAALIDKRTPSGLLESDPSNRKAVKRENVRSSGAEDFFNAGAGVKPVDPDAVSAVDLALPDPTILRDNKGVRFKNPLPNFIDDLKNINSTLSSSTGTYQNPSL